MHAEGQAVICATKHGEFLKCMCKNSLHARRPSENSYACSRTGSNSRHKGTVSVYKFIKLERFFFRVRGGS